MALRGTLTHWKTRLLAKELQMMPCQALGILEALWHTVAELAPAGNIGRLPNQAIAMEMFYEGDADALIAALITSRHLEEHPEHRLIVHDWSQHSDHNTKRKVERRGGSMIANDGSPQVMTRHKSIPVPVPEPVPVPVPEPVPEPEKKTLASTAVAVPAARGKLVCTLPLNTGEQEIFESDVQQWIPLYPAVDVRQELRNIKGWLLGSPHRRKTKGGINKFINAWFARSQNEPRTGAGNGTINRSHGKTAGNLDALAATLALIDQRDKQAADEVCGEEAGPGEPIDASDIRGRFIDLPTQGHRSGPTVDLVPPPR
jgi:hypothetical protein